MTRASDRGGYTGVIAVSLERIKLPASRAATIPREVEPVVIARRDPVLDLREELAVSRVGPLLHNPDDPERRLDVVEDARPYPLLGLDRRTAPVWVLFWYLLRLWVWRARRK